MIQPPFTTHMHNCITQFMQRFEQNIYPDIKEVPCEVSLLRADLIREELKEYSAAEVRSVDELDAILDLLYVIIGTSVAFSVATTPYRSGQVPMEVEKLHVHNTLTPLLQNLDSRFPCANLHFKEAELSIHRLIDIGTIHNYKLRAAFDAVHANNMEKLWSFSDLQSFPSDVSIKQKGEKFLVKRSDGKVLKPPSHVKVDLNAFV